MAECSKLRRALWIECQPKKWDIAYARQHGIKVLAKGLYRAKTIEMHTGGDMLTAVTTHVIG